MGRNLAPGLFLMCLFLPGAATAAVRTCHDTRVSEIVTGATELEAKKQALAQWREQAAKAGLGYDSWRLAIDKALKCFAKGTSFECVAVGRPCVIKQNPKQKPAGPDRKGEPL